MSTTRRPTRTISDALHAQAKLQAARQGGTVGAVFEAALRAYLDRSRQPGVDLDDLMAMHCLDVNVMGQACLAASPITNNA
ncbi:MAG: hypothetical protein KFB97_02080 [Cyanobium sp. M30B3]|nr:MAG: hypothetical protein KFB97_02080 [Cyanobium sp. M30B3]